MKTGVAYSFVHNAWSSIQALPIGELATLRRLRGSASESWWIDAKPRARLIVSGLASEVTLHVLSGRFSCLVLGNQVQLPAGCFAIVPPHLSVEIRVAGRSPGELLVTCATRLGDELAIEGG